MSDDYELLLKHILDDVKTQIFDDVKVLVEKEYTEKLLKKEEEFRKKLVVIEDLAKKQTERKLVVPQFNHSGYKREYELITDWMSELEKNIGEEVPDFSRVLKGMQERIEELLEADKEVFSLRTRDTGDNMKITEVTENSMSNIVGQRSLQASNSITSTNERSSTGSDDGDMIKVSHNVRNVMDDSSGTLPDIRNMSILSQGSLQPSKNSHSNGLHNLSPIPKSSNLSNSLVTDLHNQSGSSHGNVFHFSSEIGSGPLYIPLSSTAYPSRSPLKRQKMIYFLKFGEFGVNEGQFTEPSGIAVNNNLNEIIVVDTNCHRVQVFDKEGQFKLEFGGCGKRDGQLLYPNRIAVNQITGNCFITERSPTHQIQIFDCNGRFVRKFGSAILQHPRGICVDHKGRVVVVECKVMRVIIFDSFGNVLTKFGCGRYLEFPNAICTSPDDEIFISDNRAHCVKVFNYAGVYLRQIGGEGMTNYPIGVAVDSSGSIIVADNHNNFNLTIFDKHGRVLNALESKVKHAQCYDMAVLNDGTVAVSSKDCRVYLYRYALPHNESNQGFHSFGQCHED
ncbi:hypothetical protein FO519_006028 [Halicephalobus sp. NKZ332]|nr:hypothetical protein FO519_006028 [Halicephalobus sp. NKZ332]